MTQGHNVRLTTQAHQLCIEEAKRCGTSMKAVASEAIFFLFDKEKDTHGDVEWEVVLQQEQVRRKIEKELETAKRRALLLLIVTAIAAGCTGIIIGVML